MERTLTRIEAFNKSALEMQYLIASKKFKGDALGLFNYLQNKLELDNRTLGFWVFDIKLNIEYYSDKFIKILKAKREDVPNDPSFWMKYITDEAMVRASRDYQLHYESGGKHPFDLLVTYNTVDFKQQFNVICHGITVEKEYCAINKKEVPIIMVGQHLNPDGTIEIIY